MLIKGQREHVQRSKFSPRVCSVRGTAYGDRLLESSPSDRSSTVHQGETIRVTSGESSFDRWPLILQGYVVTVISRSFTKTNKIVFFLPTYIPVRLLLSSCSNDRIGNRENYITKVVPSRATWYRTSKISIARTVITYREEQRDSSAYVCETKPSCTILKWCNVLQFTR